MDYKFIADLLADVNVPTEGILSRVLQKDEHVNITLFGFSAGQELSTHSAPTPAVREMMCIRPKQDHLRTCLLCCLTPLLQSQRR